MPKKPSQSEGFLSSQINPKSAGRSKFARLSRVMGLAFGLSGPMLEPPRIRPDQPPAPALRDSTRGAGGGKKPPEKEVRDILENDEL